MKVLVQLRSSARFMRRHWVALRYLRSLPASKAPSRVSRSIRAIPCANAQG